MTYQQPMDSSCFCLNWWRLSYWDCSWSGPVIMTAQYFLFPCTYPWYSLRKNFGFSLSCVCFTRTEHHINVFIWQVAVIQHDIVHIMMRHVGDMIIASNSRKGNNGLDNIFHWQTFFTATQVKWDHAVNVLLLWQVVIIQSDVAYGRAVLG